MQKICTYTIEVDGELDEYLFSDASPIQIELVKQTPSAAKFSIYTDQPGLIGMIRHLHRQGFLILSVERVE